MLLIAAQQRQKDLRSWRMRHVFEGTPEMEVEVAVGHPWSRLCVSDTMPAPKDRSSQPCIGWGFPTSPFLVIWS